MLLNLLFALLLGTSAPLGVVSVLQAESTLYQCPQVAADEPDPSLPQHAIAESTGGTQRLDAIEAAPLVSIPSIARYRFAESSGKLPTGVQCVLARNRAEPGLFAPAQWQDLAQLIRAANRGSALPYFPTAPPVSG